MRTLSYFVVLALGGAALITCVTPPTTPTPDDDRGVTARAAPRTLTNCGNGIRDPGEQCDDGNTTNGDACENDCTLPRCGNGIVDCSEQCDDGNAGDGDGCEVDCTLPRCGNGIVDAGEQCDDGNAIDGDGCDSRCEVSTFAYLKASNPSPNAFFGHAVALSADGSTLAVGAFGEDSAATGVNGNQAGNFITDSGAVYIFTRSGTAWSQQAYLKASNPGATDHFGLTLALSADGATLAVGAQWESSAATGIDGDQADNTAQHAGAVYVFTRSGATWRQQAYVKASNTGAGDEFGASLALSADGSTLAVGADLEASAATGLGGNQADDTAPNAGAVYVFTRSGTTWSQWAYIKASNTDANDRFGASVAVSADGLTLAVGASTEASAATGIGGNQANNTAAGAGAVYVFTRSDTTWAQQVYLKPSTHGVVVFFGFSLSFSADGATLAVGAWGDASGATGIDGNAFDRSALSAGSAYVFTRSGITWSQQAYIKASNTGAGDNFGWSIALSADASFLAVSAYREASAATGIAGDQTNNAATDAGAVYLFARSGTTWSQRSYIKASNTEASDAFGRGMALSGDGTTLAVGADGEDSAATGVGGNQANNSLPQAGAVYVLQ